MDFNYVREKIASVILDIGWWIAPESYLERMMEDIDVSG